MRFFFLLKIRTKERGKRNFKVSEKKIRKIQKSGTNPEGFLKIEMVPIPIDKMEKDLNFIDYV